MLTVLSWVFLIFFCIWIPFIAFCTSLCPPGSLASWAQEKTNCEPMKCLPAQALLTQKGLVTYYCYHFYCLYLVEPVITGPMMQWYFKNKQRRTFMFLWASSREENLVGRAEFLHVVIQGPRSFCFGALPFARVWSVLVPNGSGWETPQRNWCAVF